MRDPEEFIDTVDVHQLRTQPLWPIMRVFAPRFVDEVELNRYLRRVLASDRWSVVRVVPHVDERGMPSQHIFDVYGRRSHGDFRAPAQVSH